MNLDSLKLTWLLSFGISSVSSSPRPARCVVALLIDDILFVTLLVDGIIVVTLLVDEIIFVTLLVDGIIFVTLLVDEIIFVTLPVDEILFFPVINLTEGTALLFCH